jgi:4-cresol dehydrogenase (hydroxylating)
MSATLPSAVDAFTAALGADKVITEPEAFREWRDPFQHESSDAYAASAVLMPETVEEIQAILAIANEQRVPLWTHGQGRNNGYGGPAS